MTYGIPTPESVLSTVSDVEEAIFVPVVEIQSSHIHGADRQNVCHEQKHCLLWRHLSPPTYDVRKLPDGEVVRYKIFIFIYRRDIAPFSTLKNDRHSIRKFPANAQGILLTLDERVFGFKSVHGTF